MIIYRGEYYDIETDLANENIQLLHRIDIIDTAFDDSGDPEIIPLNMTDDPCRDIVIDNDEDKFTPIRARQLSISFYSSDSISISTFAEGSDTRFKVNYYVDSVLELTGFLSLGDLSQEFMPDPNVINVIAVDGLGVLNDIPLTDFLSNTPEQENSILDYVLWCLSKTGLQLNIAIVYNIRGTSASLLNDDNDGLGHFFKYFYLDAKTWEDEIGACINCYEVLSKILGESAVLFQGNGEWRITRIDEMQLGYNMYAFRWDYEGTFISKTEETNEASIGVGEEYSWMNDDPIVAIDRPVKESRLTFKFDMPLENPCNIDFERGAAIDNSGDERTFELDCWAKMRENYPTSGLIAATVDIYVQRLYEDDYEISRYVVIPYTAVSSNLIMSSRIYVRAKDKFTVGMTRRLSSDVGGSGFYRDNGMQVRLYGNDGSYWTIQGQSSVNEIATWETSNADFTIDNHYLWFEGDLTRDMTEAESLYGNGEAPEIPVDGYIQLLAHQSHNSGWGKDTYIDSITFDYLPFINGSYEKYTGQQQLVMQDVDTRNVRERDVYISDSPNRIFKGSLLKILGYHESYTGSAIFSSLNSVTIPGFHLIEILPGQTVTITGATSNNITSKITSVSYSIIASGTVIGFEEDTIAEVAAAIIINTHLFELAGLFYDAAKAPSGGDVPIRRFGELQAFDVWNQFNRTMRKFDGTIDHTLPVPSLVNKYYLSDANENTTGKIFVLLHREIDTHLCEWQAFLIEVDSEANPKIYTGNSFKYITK